MRVVLDTNVLVSGLLSPFGTCGEIVRMLTAGVFVLGVDSRILLEYDEVLRRPKFQIDPSSVDTLMDYLGNVAAVYATVPLDRSLPDKDDNPFLEVALASGASFLVTGNLRHFPARHRQGVPVLSPKQFLDEYRASKT
ncbi:MAG: putative toxin-antitoxin system toxin component, PIN family [Candidatus Marinimicrobia bacterium]|nr:putative toxin-antitoxin system toxin component, PIN family [Candidatus Neomarinimicrobiota bacterium]